VILLYDSGFAEIIAYLTEKFSNFYERISFLSPVEDYYLSDTPLEAFPRIATIEFQSPVEDYYLSDGNSRVCRYRLCLVPIPRRGLLSFRLVIRRRQIGLK
jgi:hypothetical protein